MAKKIKIEDLPMMEDLSAEEVKGIFGGTDPTSGTTSLPGAGTTSLPGSGTTSLPGSGTTYTAPTPPAP
ncbi:MAG: hypothetical protein ACKV0T_00770 [Planctomycetales bacterium]